MNDLLEKFNLTLEKQGLMLLAILLYDVIEAYGDGEQVVFGTAINDTNYLTDDGCAALAKVLEEINKILVPQFVKENSTQNVRGPDRN